MGAGGKVTKCILMGVLVKVPPVNLWTSLRELSESFWAVFKIDNGESKLCTVTHSELIHICKINKRTKQTASALCVYYWLLWGEKLEKLDLIFVFTLDSILNMLGFQIFNLGQKE